MAEPKLMTVPKQAPDVDPELAEAIRKAFAEAKRRGVNGKTEVQKKLGVTFATVNNWARGIHSPPDGAVLVIEEVTGEPLARFLPSEPPYPAWDEFKRSPLFSALDEEEIRRLRRERWVPPKRPVLATYTGMAAALITARGEEA